MPLCNRNKGQAFTFYCMHLFVLIFQISIYNLRNKALKDEVLVFYKLIIKFFKRSVKSVLSFSCSITKMNIEKKKISI